MLGGFTNEVNEANTYQNETNNGEREVNWYAWWLHQRGKRS